MATHRERILNYLRANAAGADDDVLAAKLGIPHRQAVNQVCHRLEAEGLVARRHDQDAGRIVNRLARGADIEGSSVSSVTTTPPAHDAAVRLLRLDGDAAVREFAYLGELQLSEDEVKLAVGAALVREGWNVGTRWGRAHGIDIEATRAGERLVLEAKGEGSRPEMCVNFFLGALGEVLQHMESPDACYGLALPAHRQFAGLVSRLPAWVRARLNLRFYLVRRTCDGYEVGLVRSGDAAALSQQQTSPTREPIPTLDAEAP